MSNETPNASSVAAIRRATPAQNRHTGRLLSNELRRYLSGFDFHTQLTKRERVTIWLTIAANHELKVTRFDAEWIGDHCFNSTISEITNIDRIIVDRIPTKRPTRFGKSADCKEYWLQERALEAALIQSNCVIAIKSKRQESQVTSR